MPSLQDFNPIRLEVYRHLFFSIAEEMGTVLKRTAYSPNIKERRDYSCAVFDSQAQLAAMGDHMPVHLGSMPLSVKAAIEAAPLLPGDIVIVNDPFSGGTHLPDITMVAPVFRPSPDFDRPLFYVASRAHHSDIGGMTPGSMPLSQEIFQEGVIIPPLKLYEAGELNRSLLRLLLHNVRTPLEREGDLAAQVGSLRVGEKRLLELMERNGADELEAYVAALQDYSERMVRQLIAEIPDGEYSADDSLDDEGMAERSSRPVKIKVKIQVKGESMRIDFSGTDAQVQGSLNAVRAITVSAVFYILRCLAPQEVPSTAGLLRPVEVLAPQRSVVNASFPCATAGGNVETSQRIVDVVLHALAQALPDRIPAASSGTMNNLALGGLKPAGQQPFSYYETIGGGMGAGPQGNGDNGVHTHMTNSLNTPIEALESEFPMRVREYRLRANSGGRGEHRGGDGLVRSIEMLTAARVTMLSERRKFAPYGLSGGGAGRKGMNFVTLRGRRKKMAGKFSIELSQGDILTVETPGGGAWGSSAKGRRSADKRGKDKSSPQTAAAEKKTTPEKPPTKKPAAKSPKRPAKDQRKAKGDQGKSRVPEQGREAKAGQAPAGKSDKQSPQGADRSPRAPAQGAAQPQQPKRPARDSTPEGGQPAHGKETKPSSKDSAPPPKASAQSAGPSRQESSSGTKAGGADQPQPPKAEEKATASPPPKRQAEEPATPKASKSAQADTLPRPTAEPPLKQPPQAEPPPPEPLSKGGPPKPDLPLFPQVPQSPDQPPDSQAEPPGDKPKAPGQADSSADSSKTESSKPESDEG